MSEPSERDREMANQYICNWINLYSAKDGKWHALESAIADAIAAARAEERERCAKIALRSAQAQSAEEEYCCAGVAQDIASRIRSGQ